MDLIWAVVGIGLMNVGIVGLLKGGELPMVSVPVGLRPAMKFVMLMLLFTGITLMVGKGTPDLIERVLTGA